MLEDPEAAAPAEVFRELVAELAIKTAQRRWWGFVHGEGETLLAGSGGEVSALAMRPEGRGRALRRAIATRTPVTFDEPEPGLALDERSASGIVLPVVVAGELCGALVVESVRRRDFGEVEWSRHAETAQRAGLALRLASFRGWHRERYGHDVWFDARRRDFRDFALHLLAAARSRSPVVLCGPTGAGKAVLSRWIHFEGRGRERRLHAVECGSANLRGAFEEWAAAADGGTLVLEDVDRLALERQGEFLRRLEHRASDSSSAMPRLIATARCDLGEAVEDGRLRGDLAHRLDRLQFRVPPLAERREDIPPLVECLTRRFADEEGLRPRAYEDDVIAFLWRQTWEGNLRELESFVYKLVLLARVDGASQQRSIDAALVQSLAGRFATRLVCRIPSRHPRARDIVAALRVTRMPNGRTNKTRAAAYLGWDPDTLVARMKDCGLPDEVPEEEAWGASRGPEEGSTAG
jgi:putative methionine-R-sulfoxide reductase with GAF domain